MRPSASQMPLARLTSTLHRPSAISTIAPSGPLPTVVQSYPLHSTVVQIVTRLDDVLTKLDGIEQKIDMLA